MLDKIPPQNIEAEQELIASCVSFSGVAQDMVAIVNPLDFYRPAHQTIFSLIVGLVKDNQPVDMVTLIDRGRVSGKLEEIGGPAYILGLLDSIPSKANAPAYARIVKHKSDLRALIVGATSIIDQCYSEPIGKDDSNMVERLEKLCRAATTRGTAKKQYQHLADFMPGVVSRMLAASNGETFGLPTGFADLDKMLSGFEPSDLIILAARPSMGKSALCMNMAEYQACNLGVPVGVISLEMSGESLGQRMVCGHSGIDSYRARTGKLSDVDWQRITRSASELSKAPIFIDDAPAQKAMVIRRKAERMKDKEGIKILYVDYLQIAKADTTQSREAEIREISGELKAIAKDLNIPVVALSQLNRDCEKRVDKRPMLSDLRESGAIEQDADVILMLYRDEVYNKSPDNPNKGVAEIGIGKQRKGPTGIIKLVWDEKVTKFRDIIRMHEPC